MGGDGLGPRLREPASPGRPDRQRHRPEAHPHHRPRRFRRGVSARRRLGQLRHAGRGPDGPGTFGALLAPSVLALLTTTFTNPGERGKAFAIYGAIVGAGGAIGLLLGGILTSYASWRWTLFVNLFFAAIVVTGAVLWLKNDKAADHDPLDLPGLGLVTGGLFCLVCGFFHAETTAWSSPYTIGSLVLGLVLLAVFAFIETRAKYPLLPPRVVLNRIRGGSMLAMLFASVGIFGVFLFMTYYLQETLNFSPGKTGVAFLPMVAGLAGMAQVSNRIRQVEAGFSAACVRRPGACNRTGM